jgi:hypothetical protein
MRIHAVALAIACFFAPGSFAQPELFDRVFHFTNVTTTPDMQEIANAVRTVPEIAQASFEAESKTLSIRTTPERIALAEWIFQELDVPESAPPAGSLIDRYPGLTNPADQMRVFRMARPPSPQGYQETINAIRVIPEITKVFPSGRLRQIVVRGEESQIAMAEWLFRQLDRPAAPNGQGRAEQQLHAESLASPRSGNELRILYFANAPSPQARREIVNAIRTVPELTKVFPVSEQSAVAVRGTPDRIALAEWLFAQLDRSVPESTAKTSAVYDFSVLPSAVRIFFLGGAVAPESYRETVNTLRTMTQATRIFPCTNSRAITFRGTPEQLAQAEKILKDAGKL